MRQALAYCRYYKFELPSVTRHAKFRFADTMLPSKTMLNMFFPTPGGLKRITVDVVDANIPLLIGLDVLDEYGWNVLTVQNQLESVIDGWTMNVIRRDGHIVAPWDDYFDEFYTREQLQKLHLHFMHPSSDKLFNLLRRVKPTDVDEETRKILNEIADSCHACQTFSTKPITFQVRFPDEVVFNKEVRIDLMFPNGRPVFCIVDVGTNFVVAKFLSRVDTETIWNTFLYAWALIYAGMPRRMLTDQGSVFMSKDWKHNCERAQIVLRHTSTESHNSLGSGETYHAMIRRVFNKVSMTYPKESPELCLAFAVKAINDTAGPNGLVPTLLVFGILPRLPDEQGELPNIDDRIKMMKTAGDEYESIIATKRVDYALKRKLPPAAKIQLLVGQPVYVYREKPLKRWTGPHQLVSASGKLALVNVGEKTGPRQFNLAQVKPAKLPSISSLLPSPSPPFQFSKPTNDTSTATAPSTPQHLAPLSGPIASIGTQTPITRQAGTLPPIAHLPLPDISTQISPIPSSSDRIMMTEILDAGDPRSTWFDEAKRKELQGLIKRGTFKLVLREEIESDPNIVLSRFVLSIKSMDDGKELLKARFVLGGHRDIDERIIVHNANTLKPTSIRLMLALAAILGFGIWTTDINQAYLQSAANLQRRIFVRPDVLELEPDELLQVIKPLYGLSDAGGYWGETLTDHHLREMKMEQSTGDFSLFFKKLYDKLIGLSGTYVDDILRIGNPSFRASSTKVIGRVFDSKPDKRPPFTFNGLKVSRNKHEIHLSQTSYIMKLKTLMKKATFSDLRSFRARLAWIVHSGPDIACTVSILSQTTEKTFDQKDLNLLNKVIRHLQKTCTLSLKFPRLDENSLHLTVYSDASFDNNIDNTSQLGHIILLMDKTKRCCILQFSSHKSRRVTRSSMAAETLALADAFDNSFIINHDLQRITGRHIPLLMLIDSKLLFDVIAGDKYSTEKRLMVDIASIRESYKERTISNIGLIRSEFNIADGLTKLTLNTALRHVMETGYVDHPIKQYVIDVTEQGVKISQTSGAGSDV